MKDDESIYHVFQGLQEFVTACPTRSTGAMEQLPAGMTPAQQNNEASRPPSKGAGRGLKSDLPDPLTPLTERDFRGTSGPDELETFLEAMKDVRRIVQERTRVRGVARKDEVLPLRRESDPSMSEVLGDRHLINVVNLPEYMEGYVDDLSPLIMEKLRGGEFSIQRVLDLHGLSANDARETFGVFLREAIQSQICCIRIIHGRGLKSRSEPVLKAKLKQWILQAMHRKWVVAFASCRMADGGPGATTVLLRTRARKRKLHIVG